MGRRRPSKRHNNAVKKTEEASVEKALVKDSSDNTSSPKMDKSSQKNEETDKTINSLQKIFNKLTLCLYIRQHQTRTEVSIDINIVGIQNHPRNLIRVEFQPTSVNVEVQDIGGKDRFFRVRRFAGKIVPEKSSFVLERDKLVLKMQKASSGTWPSIHYYPPQVAENFKQKFLNVFRSFELPLPENVILDVFRDVRVDAEVYWASGVSLLEAMPLMSVVLPRNLQQPEEIIEYITKNLRENFFISFNRPQCACLSVALLHKEMKEFIAANPQSFEVYSKPESSGRKLNSQAEKHKSDGDTAFKEERFGEAVDAYSQAIALDPHCHTYYLKRSIAHSRLPMIPNECLRDAKEALTLYPFSEETYLHLAQMFNSLGVIQLSAACLAYATRLDPFNNEIDGKREQNMKFATAFDKIIDMFKSGILKPDIYVQWNLMPITNAKVNILMILIEKLCLANMIDTSKEVLKFFMEYVPPSLHPEGYYLQGMCAFYMDDEDDVHEKFAKCFKKPTAVLDQAKKLYTVAKQVFSLRKEGDEASFRKDYKKATEKYEEALKFMKYKTHAVFCSLNCRIASVKLKEKKIHESMSYLDEAIKMKSDYHQAFALRAECYINQGKYTEAIEDIEKALSFYRCEAYEALLETAKLRGKIPEKPLHELDVDAREQVLKESLINVKKRKAEKHFKDKQYDDAIEAYTKVIAVDPNDPLSYSNRSACYLMGKRFKDALADAEMAVKVGPKSADGLVALCKCHIALGLPIKALECLEMAKNINPHCENLIAEYNRIGKLEESISLGHTSFADEDFVRSERQFSIAVTIAEACLPLHLKCIDCLIKLKRFDEAIKLSRNALSLNSNDAQVLYFIGLSLYYKGEQTESVENLKKSLEIDPNQENVKKLISRIERVTQLKERGNEAFREKRWSNALSTYLEGISIECEPTITKAHLYHNFGMATVEHLSPLAAILPFSNAILLKTDYVKAYLKRAKCYTQEREFEKAVKDYETVNRIQPSDQHKKLLIEAKNNFQTYLKEVKITGMNVTLADKKAKSGKISLQNDLNEHALQDFKEAISLNPKCPEYYLDCCECHMKLNNYTKALENAKQAIERDDTSVKGFIALGKCYNALGCAEEAVDAFENARKLDHDIEIKDGIAKSDELKDTLQNANIALDEKKYKTACGHFKNAFEIAYASPSVLVKYVECALKSRDTHIRDQAFKASSQALNETERSPEAGYALGKCNYYMDERKKAVDHLKEALELDPSNRETKQLLSLIQTVYEKVSAGDEACLKENHDAALLLYKEAIAVDLEKGLLQAKIYCDIGSIQKRKNQVTDAINSFSLAIDLANDYTDALQLRGECFRQTKQYEKSLQDYQKLYDLTNSQAYLHLLNDVKLKLEISKSKLYYKVLDVPDDASQTEIRKAFRFLAKKYHPDAAKATADATEDDKFKEISRAYSTLRDPDMRKQYDSRLQEDVIVLKYSAPDPKVVYINIKLRRPLLDFDELHDFNENSGFYDSD